jgi:hypothetical protein
MTSQKQKTEKDDTESGTDYLNNLSSFLSSSSSQFIAFLYQTLMQYKKATGLENQGEFFSLAITKVVMI